MLSYRDFIQAYVEEMDAAQWSPVEQDYEEATDKSKIYKENYIFRDSLQRKHVSPVLAKPANREKLIEFTASFIDENATALSKPGPVLMIRFTDTHINTIYDMFHTSKEEVMELFQKVVQETYYGKLSKPLLGLVERAPHKLVLVAVLIDAYQNNYTDILECMAYLLPFIEYPMLFSHYWPTGVKEDVMEYTVEHMSSKFKLKKVSNLQGLLRWDGQSTIDYFVKRFGDGQDHWYVDVIYGLRNRLNNTFRNISSKYYKNSKAGNTQHQSTSQFDDGSVADNVGITNNISQIIETTVNKFASGTMNLNILKICAEGMQVDRSNLESFLNQIYTDRTAQIPRFVECVIQAYFHQYPTATRINASEFVSYGLSLYRSIATSQDPILKEIRDILNHWMQDIIKIQSLYTREGTKSVYTRAVFNYFILMINYYN